ncbi:hypothetical protein DMN91_001943 [Ooceraea biroi]|uniref:Uncharacterized protein n=1 Tax=Ooceraea biroi TaxID=2015173 RepID=A0A3L8DZB3_OOCBI|nr:hypothetical protein DMN91_001943 [Ooceraea biroi]
MAMLSVRCAEVSNIIAIIPWDTGTRSQHRIAFYTRICTVNYTWGILYMHRYRSRSRTRNEVARNNRCDNGKKEAKGRLHNTKQRKETSQYPAPCVVADGIATTAVRRNHKETNETRARLMDNDLESLVLGEMYRELYKVLGETRVII